VSLQTGLQRPERILFIFLDGVGIGVNDPRINPLAHLDRGFFPLFLESEESSRVYRQGRQLTDHPLAAEGFHAAVDACLGVAGTPQSATGQATLLTGYNGAALLGYHLTAFPNDPLIRLVREHNLLRRATLAGKSAAFLNTYTPRFYELGYPYSVSTLCALSLPHPLFMLNEMHMGRSLFHDITQEGLRELCGETIPVFTPDQAGKRLAGAAEHWSVSLYEHFWTDRIGHKGNLALAIPHARRVESFLAGVLEASDLERTLVVVATDHGNLEEARHKGHTRNPVPVSAWGPGAEHLTSRVKSLTDVTPCLLELMAEPKGSIDA
jgi:hypothetical protein